MDIGGIEPLARVEVPIGQQGGFQGLLLRAPSPSLAGSLLRAGGRLPRALPAPGHRSAGRRLLLVAGKPARACLAVLPAGWSWAF
eukprot:15441381-Alexandrium_andersonii.AAC.1